MQHPKSFLIKRCQALNLGKPSFNTKPTGPAHEPTFISDVIIQNEVYGTGQGGNKRDAEKHASEEALALLNRQTPWIKEPSLEGNSSLRNDTSLENDVPRLTYLSEETFEGPWPIFAEVLAASLTAANSRVDNRLKGEKAIVEIQSLALKLYKGSLESLGEIVEMEE